jgi:hypothetical protein
MDEIDALLSEAASQLSDMGSDESAQDSHAEADEGADEGDERSREATAGTSDTEDDDWGVGGEEVFSVVEEDDSVGDDDSPPPDAFEIVDEESQEAASASEAVAGGASEVEGPQPTEEELVEAAFENVDSQLDDLEAMLAEPADALSSHARLDAPEEKEQAEKPTENAAASTEEGESDEEESDEGKDHELEALLTADVDADAIDQALSNAMEREKAQEPVGSASSSVEQMETAPNEAGTSELVDNEAAWGSGIDVDLDSAAVDEELPDLDEVAVQRSVSVETPAKQPSAAAGSEEPDGWSFVQKTVLAVAWPAVQLLKLCDVPFAGLSLRLKTVLGIVAIATTFVAAGTWAVTILYPDLLAATPPTSTP